MLALIKLCSFIYIIIDQLLSGREGERDGWSDEGVAGEERQTDRKRE